MVEEIDKGSAQLKLLKEINEAANRGEGLDEILQSAVEGVGRIFGYVACDLFLLEDEETHSPLKSKRKDSGLKKKSRMNSSTLIKSASNRYSLTLSITQ